MKPIRLRGKKLTLVFVLIVIGVALISILLGEYGLGKANFASTIREQPSVQQRIPWLWPFSSGSIWNHPIGRAAEYHLVKIPVANVVGYDLDLLFEIPSNSPLRPLYDPGSWTNRCSGETTYENLLIPIPDNLVVSDAVDEPGRYETPNNAAALLQADGRTIIQLEPMARCKSAGPVYGYRWPKQNVDLYGEGIAGSHLGSGLSALGGAIRKGELLGNHPIRHALKLEFWEEYLYYDADGQHPGYRWPADRSDGQAASIYKGTDPELVMGSLMAIPPTITEKSLGLKTIAGHQIFLALRDFGGYVVDSTGWDAAAIAIEAGVEIEVERESGYSLNGNSANMTDFYNDFNHIIQVLAVVTDNQPNQVGGKGKPRTNLAPPLLPPE